MIENEYFCNSFNFFEGLSEEEIKVIRNKSIERNFPKGSFLYMQGDVNKFVYIIINGRVKTFKVTREGEETIININYPHEVTGLAALRGDSKKVVSTQCIDDVLVWVIPAEELMNIMKHYNQVSINIVKILVSKLNYAYVLIEDLSLKEISARLSHLLFNLVKRCGIQDSKGFLIPRFTHQELANMIGSSRPTVSINMNMLISEGILSFEKDNIRISDMNSLLDLANIS